MGDRQGGAAVRHSAQRRLDVLFGTAVQGAGGLVQDQNPRVFQNGPGDGDSLLLAAGQLQAALPNPCVVAFG